MVIANPRRTVALVPQHGSPGDALVATSQPSLTGSGTPSQILSSRAWSVGVDGEVSNALEACGGTRGEGVGQCSGVAAEALARIRHGDTTRDHERPVAGLQRQQLSHGGV